MTGWVFWENISFVLFSQRTQNREKAKIFVSGCPSQQCTLITPLNISLATDKLVLNQACRRHFAKIIGA